MATMTEETAGQGRILLVDDDRSLVDVLGMALEDEGFTVSTAHDGRAGWQAFGSTRPDLVILDLLMPELDGLQLCRLIRRQHTTPVIMLTSRDEEMDRVLGLELGADDYVTKPFSTRELIARVRAALRRASMTAAPPAEPEVLRDGPLRLDRAAWQAWLEDQPLRLTATELELLWTLLAQPGRVFSREELIDRVYGAEVVVTPRTMDTFVKRLRQKLGQQDPEGGPLVTVRGIGYRYQRRG